MGVNQRIFGNLTLRPTRLAFFVSPSHPSHLQRAMEINTCLWGGLHNPILPHGTCLNRRRFWPADPPAESEMIDSYIRSFEPEVLVVPDTKTFPRTALVQDREVVTIDDLYAWLSENMPRVGISMFHIYRFLWQDSFRFEHRVKTRFVLPKPPFDWPLFVAATWGAFPPTTERSSFTSWYEQLTSPESEAFTEKSFAGSYTNEWRDPLGFTLSQTRTMGRSEAHIMLLRPEQPLDVMAFWTLRSLGHYVVPVPLQWRKSMIPLARQIVEHNTVPHREYVTICRGPRTSFRLVREFAMAVSDQNARAVASQWYPRIWSSDFLRFDRTGSRLEADASSVEATCDEGRVVRLRTLTPKFIQRMGWTGSGRWTNCFETWSHVQEDEQNLVLPSDLTKAQRLFGLSGGHDFLASRHGVLINSHHPDSLQWMRVPTGSAVIHHWLQEHGFETRTSSAGNLAASLTRAMGGPRGMYWLGYPALIEALNHTASLPGKHVQPKQSIEREIQNALSAHSNILRRTKEEIFDWLLEHGALRLGLATPCTACRQQNWYPIDKTRYRLVCDRCGKRFAFPSKNPKDAWWAYSLAGPFSVPSYVAGGYGAVAALHAIDRTHSNGCMWSFGVEMKEKATANAAWHEIDVLAMVKEYGNVVPMFVEAKSGLSGQGGTISEDEIGRAEYLLGKFPTAVAVFSTMAVTFEPESAARLKAFVERLQSRTVGDRDSAKPVVLLGQHELFGAFSLGQAWKDVGGKHAEFAEKWPNVHSMLDICYATQALHLQVLQANGGPGG